jgi:hypothetical protein
LYKIIITGGQKMTSGATAGGETAAANWPSGETAAAKRHRPNPYVIDPMAPKIKCMVGGNHLIDPLFIDGPLNGQTYLDLHVLPALENIRPLHQIIFQQDE